MNAQPAGECFEQIVPEQFRWKAAEVVILENTRNASPFEVASVNSKLRKLGRTFRVTFLGSIREIQQKAEKYSYQWSQYTNLTFQFVEDPAAEIRISFDQQGSWSALGTDALVEEYFPKNGPTMNFGWLTPDSSDTEYSSVVLHEFGHALGLIHEHQNPAGGIQWNREAVIRELSGWPNYWDEATIQFNVFDRYSTTQTQFTAFDPKSIMLYSFPRHWTLNNLEFPENTELSQTDKDFIKARYPK